jgi:hypothetical protein
VSQDDLRRGSLGVIAALVRGSDGRLRLVFDDASSDSDTYPQEWQVRNLYTYKDFDAEQVLNIALTEHELADIGLSLVARLVAFDAISKKKQQDD